VENKLLPYGERKRQRPEISPEDQAVMRAGGVVAYRKTGDGRLIRTVERGRKAPSSPRASYVPTRPAAPAMTDAEREQKIADMEHRFNLRRQAGRFSR
jgi:hypothetical protein